MTKSKSTVFRNGSIISIVTTSYSELSNIPYEHVQARKALKQFFSIVKFSNSEGTENKLQFLDIILYNMTADNMLKYVINVFSCWLKKNNNNEKKS